MRRLAVLLVGVAFLLPTVARAHAYPVPWSRMQEPDGEAEEDVAAPDDAGEAMAESPSSEDGDAEPTYEREHISMRDFNRHGVGFRAGITVVPTWLLSSFLASHTNALCKGGNIGGFAADRGLSRQDGCNFYVGGEYIYRKSRVLDIVAAVGYQSAKAPDGYWLDKDECDGDVCNMAAADYTQIDLGMVFFEADFIARAPVVLTPNFELGIGGGGGIGLGIVTGGVYQTPIGAPATGPSGAMTCNTLEDLSDFTRCTPHYDISEDEDMTPPPPTDFSEPSTYPFAQCDEDSCNHADLKAFGYQKKQDDIPPVVPVVNLIVSVRMLIKDAFGINLQGGWNTGFYFGGSLSYMFSNELGKKNKDKAKKADETTRAPRVPSGTRLTL